MREGVLELDGGRRLAYAEHGDLGGEPAVFLHGFPGSRLAGGFLADAARRRGIRLLAPERPGVGRSDRLPGRTIAAHADDVLALAGRLRIERFGVAALSGGAPYALALRLAAPERVHGVVLASPLPPPGAAGLREEMAALQRAFYVAGLAAPRLTGGVLALAARLARHAPELYLRLSTLGSAGPDRQVLRGSEAGRRVAADFAEAFRRDGADVVEDLRLVARPWGFELEDVDGPVVAFHGAEDRVVPLRAARAYERRVPGARFVVVPGEGHFSLVVRRADDLVAALRGDGR